MRGIAASVFIFTLLFVVPASAADEEVDRWSPMWNVAYWQAFGLQVPLGIRVNEPSPIARQIGVTKEMVERVVELFLRRNGIPSEPETDDSKWLPHIHVVVSALKLEYDARSGCEPAIVFKIDFTLRKLEEVKPGIPRWKTDEAYAYHEYWTHGMLGFAAVERFPSRAREYLSEAIDLFSLDFLRARDEVSADFEHTRQTIE